MDTKDSIRNRVARIIGECGDEYYLQETASPEEIADQIHKEYMAWFRSEISKLKPLSELELSLLLESRQEVPSERDNVVALAQLTKTKEDLLKTLEVK